MTIIRPNHNKYIRNYIILFLGIIIIALLLQVFVYSRVVVLRHDIDYVKNRVEVLHAENSDLRAGLYHVLDHKNIERLARDMKFIQDKNPKWVSVIGY